jgi:integrase/recombinase XerD
MTVKQGLSNQKQGPLGNQGAFFMPGRSFGHRQDLVGSLFHPTRKPMTRKLEKPLAPSTVHHRIVKKYARRIGLGVAGFCVHSLRATAATNALEHAADIAKVQEWLGHSNIATTRLYDRRSSRPEDSPTIRVTY